MFRGMALLSVRTYISTFFLLFFGLVVIALSKAKLYFPQTD